MENHYYLLICSDYHSAQCTGADVPWFDLFHVPDGPSLITARAMDLKTYGDGCCTTASDDRRDAKSYNSMAQLTV
eukprot:scaffold348252_cov142-Cyclotella_meneghiniana.AAC.1